MNAMRQNLAQVYNAKWVARLSDAQVIAIHRRLQKSGRIKV